MALKSARTDGRRRALRLETLEPLVASLGRAGLRALADPLESR